MKKRVFALILGAALCFSLICTASAAPVIDIGNGGQIVVPDGGGTNPDPGPGPVDPGWYNPGTTTPSNPSYSVSNSNSGKGDNGTWTTDKSSAKKGDTVTITVKPSDGYQGTPVVKDKDGNNVSVSSLGDNKYSFVMPDGKVTVSMDFIPVAPVNPFVDVKQGDYFYDAVLWAVSKGITNGTSANQFSPNLTCTRAQTVTFLWRAAGSPAPKSTTNPFTDVQPGAYYYNAVLWAVENGVTNGTSADKFSPDATVTRGQTVTFMFRAAKAQAVTGNNPFVDVKTGEYYADAVQWAVSKNITNGTSATTFGPGEGCTRGQIVTFLYRAQ